MRKFLFLVYVLAISFILGGCVERKLYVKTEPPGATFYFDDKEKGETPLSFDFEWYWTHKVRLEKEGYKQIEKFEVIKAPPYMWIPIDFFMELLPFKIKDNHHLNYKLEKASGEEENKKETKKTN